MKKIIQIRFRYTCKKNPSHIKVFRIVHTINGEHKSFGKCTLYYIFILFKIKWSQYYHRPSESVIPLLAWAQLLKEAQLHAMEKASSVKSFQRLRGVEFYVYWTDVISVFWALFYFINVWKSRGYLTFCFEFEKMYFMRSFQKYYKRKEKH